MGLPETINLNIAEGVLSLYPQMESGVEALFPVPQVMFNVNARVRAGGRDYFLKKLNFGRSMERHELAAGFQNYLQVNGFCCPPALPNNAGTLVTSHEGAMWSIQPWVEGRNLSHGQRRGTGGCGLQEQVGGSLGRLHALGREFSRVNHNRGPAAGARVSIVEIQAGALQRFDAFNRNSWLLPSKLSLLKWKPAKNVLQKEVLSSLPVLEAGCAKLASFDFTGYPEEHTAFSHGDINWENLFFNGDELAAFLDFENAMEMCQLYELASALAVIGEGDPAAETALLMAYERETGLTIDQDLLPALMLLRLVQSLLWQADVAVAGRRPNLVVASRWVRVLGKSIHGLLHRKRPVRMSRPA